MLKRLVSFVLLLGAMVGCILPVGGAEAKFVPYTFHHYDQQGEAIYQDEFQREFYLVNGTYYPIELKRFQRVQSYASGMFADVPADAWYANSVAAVYELGLMKGDSGGNFNPQGQITLAETYALAARLTSIYRTGSGEFTQGSPWYQVYYDFLDQCGHGYSDLSPTAVANREDFALAMAATTYTRPERYTRPYHIYDKTDWPVINEVLYSEIRGLDEGISPDKQPILRLYKAGVLTGSDAYGSFHPAEPITRAEVAAIVERIAFPQLRRQFTLAGHQPIALTFYEGTGMPTVECITGLPCTNHEVRTFESNGVVRTIFDYENATAAHWNDYMTYVLDYVDGVVGKGGFFDIYYDCLIGSYYREEPASGWNHMISADLDAGVITYFYDQ